MSKAASTTSTIRVLPHQVPTVTLETSWIDGQMLSQVTGSVNATAVLDPQCDRGEDIHWQWVLLDGANWTLLRYLKSEPRELLLGTDLDPPKSEHSTWSATPRPA